jgi:phenylpyruvate tautomerase PptA (4-oxalocrotonate tautomerase family)
MARALSIAALAAERGKDFEGAADLYLWAGHSAAAQICVSACNKGSDALLMANTCTTLEGRLTVKQKSKIAGEITRIHSEVTGAPGFFAQVIFSEVKAGDFFMGGAVLKHDHIFVYGHTGARLTRGDAKRARERSERAGRHVASATDCTGMAAARLRPWR